MARITISNKEEIFKFSFSEIINNTPIINSQGDEITVLNKAERKEIINDSPSTDDITIYYGIAEPLTLESAPNWLITRVIYLFPDFDSKKTYASKNYDQIWDSGSKEYLSHTYK